MNRGPFSIPWGPHELVPLRGALARRAHAIDPESRAPFQEAGESEMEIGVAVPDESGTFARIPLGPHELVFPRESLAMEASAVHPESPAPLSEDGETETEFEVTLSDDSEAFSRTPFKPHELAPLRKSPATKAAAATPECRFPL